MCAPSRAPRAAQARRRRAEPCAAFASATAGPRAGCCCRARASGSPVTATATRRRAAQQVSASRRAGTRAASERSFRCSACAIKQRQRRRVSADTWQQKRPAAQHGSRASRRVPRCVRTNPTQRRQAVNYTPPTLVGAVKAERERAGGRRRTTHLEAAAAARLRYTLHLVSRARSHGGFQRARPSASLIPPLPAAGWLRDCGLVSRPHFPHQLVVLSVILGTTAVNMPSRR